jgi:hypothetical protein
MLTLFSIPKPFQGHVGQIQRNAIESWRALHPDIQILLVGDEAGVEDAAREHCVGHVGGLELNGHGTPRLDSAFAQVATVAVHPLWCLINGDIILLDDFVPAVKRVSSSSTRFLIIGESRDLNVEATELGGPEERMQLRARAIASGRLRGYCALDYFVFPAALYNDIPPFAIGRAVFDNWLVWKARDEGADVIDATKAVVSVHQSHDYTHVAGGLQEVYYGVEARHNEWLAGGREHVYSLHDATHRIRASGRVLPYFGSTFRAREKARSLRARVDTDIIPAVVNRLSRRRQTRSALTDRHE